jgi:hypothetical protein
MVSTDGLRVRPGGAYADLQPLALDLAYLLARNPMAPAGDAVGGELGFSAQRSLCRPSRRAGTALDAGAVRCGRYFFFLFN